MQHTSSQDPLFIIKKVSKKFGAQTEEKLEILELYYIINGVIYMSPTIHDSIAARMVRLFFCLQATQFNLFEC